MGDNVYLGDRDGRAHTPMQWTADSNGGFSQADSRSSTCPAHGPGLRVQACKRQRAATQ